MLSGSSLTGRGVRSRVIGAGAAVLVTASALTVISGAPAARADSVRSAEMWVLNDINVRPAWRLSQGHGVVIAVIDSGIDGQVSDLSGSVLAGPDYTGVQHPARQPQLGRARHLDGLAHRGPRPRPRRCQRHHRRGAAVPRAVGPGHHRQARPRLRGLRAAVAAPRPGGAGRGHPVRGRPRRRGDQHVAGLRRAQPPGPRRAPGRLRPPGSRRGLVRQLGHRGRGQGQRHRSLLVPGQLPRRARRRGGGPGRPARLVLQRQRLGPGRRARRQRARPGPGRRLLAGQRDQPGLRAHRGRGRADQVALPPADGRTGRQRHHHVGLAPAQGRARRAGRVRHRERRRRAAGGPADRSPGRGRAHGGRLQPLRRWSRRGSRPAGGAARAGRTAVVLPAGGGLPGHDRVRGAAAGGGPAGGRPRRAAGAAAAHAGLGLLPAAGEEDDPPDGREPGEPESADGSGGFDGSDGSDGSGGLGGYRGSDGTSGFVRFPWQASSGGRHAAPSDRSGGAGPGGRS